MPVIRIRRDQTTKRAAVGWLWTLLLSHVVTGVASAAILPLGVEQDGWSDLAFPSGVTGGYDAGTKQFTITATPSNDLEIGPQFGPSNPGRHYGNGGTLGDPFSATLNVTGVTIEPNGTVSNGGTVSVVLNGSAPGSIGDDYGISNGAQLLTGSVLEVLLDATGDNTLDVVFSVTGGALQNDNPAPNVGKFAPANFGLLRIAGVTMPSAWTSSFSLNGATVDVLAVPEPAALTFGALAAALGCVTLARRRQMQFGGK